MSKKKKITTVRTEGTVFFDDYITQVHDNGIDFVNREIYVVGEIASQETAEFGEPGVEYLMANRFIKNIRILDLVSHEPILVHMKTCGGYWEEGMAIFDAINTCKSRVIILNYTHARSMSSIILQSADKRVMMPHSYFMYHMGDEEIGGPVEGVKSQYKWNRIVDEKMYEIYCNRMKEKGAMKEKSKKAIKEYLKAQMKEKMDVFLPPSEAVRLGLADEIFDGNWEKLKRV